MAGLVKKALSEAGIEADVFGTVDQALSGLRALPYSALIIDRHLPDGDGLELLRTLRKQGMDAPCLFLTARDALNDRIEGLESGADDYIAKPFSMLELVARVRALLRRPAQTQSLNPEYGGLRICPDEGRMECGEESVSLAAPELQLMLTLVRAEGKTVRRSALQTAAWGLSDPVTPNALDVALHRLRRKLLAIDSALQIVNVRGHGYALGLATDAQVGTGA